MAENNETVVEQSGATEATPKPQRDWKEMFQGNRNAIIIAAVVILLAVVGITYYRSAKKEKEQEAALALSRITAYVDANDIEKALNGDPSKKVRGFDVIGLVAIVDQYASTGAGKTAALEAANLKMIQQKYDEAEKFFDIAAGSESAFIRANATAGLAACLEKKNNFAEAAKTYEKAATMSEAINSKDKFQYYAAISFEKAGDKESAIRLFKNVILEFEYSEYASEARAGLSRLGTVLD